jgi:zinc protease
MTINSADLSFGDLCFGPGAATGARPAKGPDVETFTLENGLEVVVVPDHRAPVVTHMIWYRVGSADEQRGKSGIAHFLEHLMFKGTKAHPAGTFSNTVSELGGQENAFTSYDYTAYFQRVPKAALKTMMEFEADRMSNLILTDDVVLPERDVILEERRSRTDSDPAAQLSKAVSSALWMNHPYGLPIIGWDHEIAALGREDALAFYDRYYTPNNAILVVAGDIDTKEVKALARDTYGKVMRRADPPPRLRPREPVQVAARRVALADPRVRQPSISRVYLAPSYRTAEGEDAYALDILSVVFGGGSTSRLYRSLVVERGIAAGAGAYYGGTSLDESRFVIYASPRPGHSLADMEKALDQELARLIDDGVQAGELERAKTRLIADTIYDLDSQASLARTFGSALTTGMDIKSVLDWPERIRAVTAEQLVDVAKRVLVLRQSVTGLLESAPEAA